MPRRKIPDAIRHLVIERAQWRCEYCLLAENDSYAAYNIDHVISLKHRGSTITENLALACADCNRNKGSDIATIDPRDEVLVRLYNPRQDSWAEHFVLVGARIEGRTAVGRGTVIVLQLNEPARVRHRAALQTMNRYPHR